MTNCITSLPSAFSTATEMVSRWTSRPTYLMLFIGCSFRQAWLTASHSSHSLLRKGRPFIMRAPGSPFFWLVAHISRGPYLPSVGRCGAFAFGLSHPTDGWPAPRPDISEKSTGGCPIPASVGRVGLFLTSTERRPPVARPASRHL